MSILIHGMEMPKAGNWITVRIYYEGTCAEPNWQGDCRYMKGCEAVPVPPHGRLIDADVLCERLMTAWHTADSEGRRIIGEVMADVVTPIVVGTPTIIEAEGAEG